MENTKLSIIILNFNGKQDTLNCLLSLAQADLPTDVILNLIVVDNASTDGSESEIQRQFPQITYQYLMHNTGYAAGNNHGIKYTMSQGADYVMIINNDTTVHKDLLRQMIDGARRHPQAGILAPKIYFAKGREFHKSRYKKSELGKVIWSAGGKIDWANMYGINRGMDEIDTGQFDTEEQIDNTSGCCMLLTKECLAKVKGFDEKFFMYYEDVDLCIRAQKAGWQIWYLPQAKIWHESAGASAIGSVLQDYYIARNRMLVGMRYAPLKTKIALIKESTKLLVNGRQWQKVGIKDFYIQNFGKGGFNPRV